MVGKVYLVGAGPGDPGLITVRGLQCLEEADVVVYDRLIDHRLLEQARAGAELVFVGKGPRQRTMEQEEINQLLAERAQEEKVVVRLKGGDPFVFGRGGEEALALAQSGVPFEVVPGVTSAIAAPAYAGIPLTHRKLASSFTVVTGSEDPAKEDSSVQWDVLAATGGTIVVLMGWESLGSVVESLSHEGMDPSTPVALVRWGAEPYQSTVVGTLENIVQRGKDAGLSPPVVAVIGEVVKLREQIRWFDNRPLFGKRVLVTRSRSQASVLSEMLAQEGAEPVEVPTIEISPLDDQSLLDDAIKRLDSYQWVIFTSTNGVEALFNRLAALGLDARSFAGARVGAIGPATAHSISQRGICADFVPREYVSEAVIKGLEGMGLEGARVLLPSADIGREALADGLTQLGAQVDQVSVYHTIAPQDSGPRVKTLLSDGKIDVATFTSSSMVRNLISLLNGDPTALRGAVIGCIGPITAATAKEMGLQVDVMARQYTVEGLVEALKEYFGDKKVSNGDFPSV